jgi:hypothetical protein
LDGTFRFRTLGIYAGYHTSGKVAPVHVQLRTRTRTDSSSDRTAGRVRRITQARLRRSSTGGTATSRSTHISRCKYLDISSPERTACGVVRIITTFAGGHLEVQTSTLFDLFTGGDDIERARRARWYRSQGGPMGVGAMARLSSNKPVCSCLTLFRCSHTWNVYGIWPDIPETNVSFPRRSW